MSEPTNREGGTSNPALPTTIPSAVKVLVARLPETAKRRLIATPESDLILEHFQLGAWIRDLLGLWGANTELLADCRVAHPDDASLVILESLWRRVREEAAADAMIGLMTAAGNRIESDEPLLVVVSREVV